MIISTMNGLNFPFSSSCCFHTLDVRAVETFSLRKTFGKLNLSGPIKALLDKGMSAAEQRRQDIVQYSHTFYGLFGFHSLQMLLIEPNVFVQYTETFPTYNLSICPNISGLDLLPEIFNPNLSTFGTKIF